MTDAGLIRSAKAPGKSADLRRKHYGLTAAGRTAVTAEALRLQQLVSAARARNVIRDRA